MFGIEKFVIVASKRGAVMEWRGGQRQPVTDVERLAGLPDDPPKTFAAVVGKRGQYKDLAPLAVRANQVQMASGFLDWLFCVEPVSVERA